MKIFNEDYKIKTLWGNLECTNSPTKHRHNTEICLQDLFCQEDPLIQIDKDHKQIPEKIPLTSPDFDRSRKESLFPNENGKYAGYDDFIN